MITFSALIYLSFIAFIIFNSQKYKKQSNNIHVKDGVSEDKFVETREARDATLSMPKLIIPATQVNMRAGDLPEEEENGVNYLKIPINKLWKLSIIFWEEQNEKNK